MHKISSRWILACLGFYQAPLLASMVLPPPAIKVAYTLSIKAPDHSEKTTAQCILQYKGINLARSSVYGSDFYAFTGTMLVPSGVRQLQMICSNKGYETLRSTVNLQGQSLNVEACFNQPSLYQDIVVNAKEGVARVRLKIPKFQREKFEIDGRKFIRLSSDNEDIFSSSFTGKPFLPEFPQSSLLFALPLDAVIANVQVEGKVTAEESFLLLPQKEPGPADSVDPIKPVFADKYYFYEKPSIEVQKDFAYQQIKDREQNLVKVTTALVDFFSQKSVVRFYDELIVTVNFKSASPCFRPTFTGKDAVDLLRSRQLVGLSQQVLNSSDILNYCRSARGIESSEPVLRTMRAVNLNITGANLLVVAPPEFMEWANAFRLHKEELGIRTVILPWEGGKAEDLKQKLTAYHDRFRPNAMQWILLLGDVDRIPTYYDRDMGDAGYGDHALNAGDMYYTQFPDANTVYTPALDANIGIGRIPAKTVDELKAVLTRTMNFEKTPPTFDSFYQSPAVAATLQIQANADTGNADNYAEFMEQYIAKPFISTGFRPERIYRTDSEMEKRPLYWSAPTPLSPSPKPIDYASLEVASPNMNPAVLFHMDGSQDTIDDALTRGTAVLFNRGHASLSQWAYPTYSYDTNRFSLFPANRPPVVFSLSCLTGFFDSETIKDAGNITGPESDFNRVKPGQRSMAEGMLLDPNGVLAIVGGTRMSHWTFNNRLTKGVARSVIYKQMTNGNALSPRLGDILVDAKTAAKKVNGPVGDPMALEKTNRHHQLIYNLLGDPSLELRTQVPLFVATSPTLTYDGEAKTLRLQFRIASPVCAGCDFLQQSEQPILVLMDSQNNIVSRGVSYPIVGPRGENREVLLSAVNNYWGSLLRYTISGAGLLPFPAVIDNRIR